MNASLPDLQTAVDSSVVKAASGSNIATAQQDRALPQSFGPFLEQAALEVLGPLSPDDALSPQVENLYQELQKLPEGGKWLPLLQQVLDDTAAAGGDPHQVLQRLVGSVRQLESEQSLSVEQSLHAVLTQYLSDPSALPRTSVPAEASLPVDGLQSSASALRIQQATRTDGLPQAVPSAPSLADKLPADAVLSSPDRTVGLFAQPVADHRLQPEQTALAAALRQFTRTQQSSAADTPARIESLSAALAGQPSTASGAQITATLPSVNVNHSLTQPGWDQAFGEKIQWMVNQRVQGAQIRLNPAQLGPMEVNIQVKNDQASIQFNSAHVLVREALEAAIPRLRDMMESSGVELVDVDVSGQSFAERQTGSGQEPTADNAFSADEMTETTEGMVETSVAAAVSAGRLDLFA